MIQRHKIAYYTPFAVGVFFFSPLFSLPVLLWGVYRGEKSAYVLLALLVGLLAWLQLPLGDLYRHTVTAEDYRLVPYADIPRPEGATWYTDNFASTAGWLVIHSGLPYQTLALVEMFWCFLLQTIVFRHMVERSPRLYTGAEVLTRFAILFLLFELIMSCTGVRNGFSLYNYVFALHLLFNRKRWLPALLFLFLAVEGHTSYLFFVPLSAVLYYAFRTRRTSLVAFLVAAVGALSALSLLSGVMGKYAEWYFGSGGELDGVQQLNINGYLLFVVPRLFLLPFVYLAWKHLEDSPQWGRMVLGWGAMALVFAVNEVMVVRLAWIVEAISPFLLLDVEKSVALGRKAVRVLVLAALALTFASCLNLKTVLLESRYPLAALPVPAILNSRYDLPWILDHIDNNTLKKHTDY